MIPKSASSYLPHNSSPKIHPARGATTAPRDALRTGSLLAGGAEKQEAGINEWMNGVWIVWGSRCVFEAMANLGRCVHLSGYYLQHPLAGLLRVLSVISHKIPFPGHFRHCPARSEWLISDLAVFCLGLRWSLGNECIFGLAVQSSRVDFPHEQPL